MRRFLRASLIVIPLMMILWIMLWLFVAPPDEILRGGPTRPNGFPTDAKRIYNFLDGSDWYYCRNTPSGHVWIGKWRVSEPFFRIQAGTPCGLKTRPDLIPSNVSPAFIVGPSVGVRFVLPPDMKRGWNEPCRPALGLAYLVKMKKILSEVAALDDAVVRSKRILLRTVSNRLSSSDSSDLKDEGADGNESYCSLR
ncbi:MAG: hypothetical protein WCY11_19705 [Novosphingobium sp.]